MLMEAVTRTTFPLVMVGWGGHSGISMEVPTSSFLFGCERNEQAENTQVLVVINTHNNLLADLRSFTDK